MPEECLEVLIVDDEPDVCWALEHLLRRSGFLARVAQVGQEAISLVSRGHFRVVLLDAKLPDVDGLEIALRIRQIDRQVPIVLISGYYYKDDPTMQQARASGLVQAFIGKPFQHEEVVEMVRRASSFRPEGLGFLPG